MNVLMNFKTMPFFHMQAQNFLSVTLRKLAHAKYRFFSAEKNWKYR